MVEQIQLEIGREYALKNLEGTIYGTYMGLIDNKHHSFFILRENAAKLPTNEPKFLEILVGDEGLIVKDSNVRCKEGYQFGYRGVTQEHPFVQDKDTCKIINGIIDRSGIEI